MAGLNIEKALEVSGNNNKYQKLLLITSCLVWFCVDFLSINVATLLFFPEMKCLSKKSGVYVECTEKDCCDENLYSHFIPEVKYNNILTDRKLYCEKLQITMVAGVFTFGVVVGSYLASYFADNYGRKLVALVSLISFSVFTVLFGLIDNTVIMIMGLFVIGLGSAGGTLSSFVLTMEVVDTNKRNLYGVIINSSYGVSGLIYYGVFQLSGEWMYMWIISVFCGLISALMLIIFFSESPRYYIAAGRKVDCLKALLNIAHMNGRRNLLMQFIKEEVLTDEQLFHLDQTIVNQLSFRYTEAYGVIDTLDYNPEHDEPFTNEHSKIFDSRRSEKCRTSIEEQISEELRTGIKELATSIGKDEDDFNTIVHSIPISKNKGDPGMTSLCKYKSVRSNFFSLSVIWMFTVFAYYGSSYDMKKIGSEIFVNGYIMYSAEFVAYWLCGVLMDIPLLGRVRTIGYNGLLVTASCVLYYFFRDNSPYNYILLFLFRITVTSIFGTLYTFSTEIYPTSIRSKGFGLNVTFAKISTMVVAVTIDYYNPYPIFAGMGLAVFLLHFYLTETRGMPLKDQIPEIQEMKESCLIKESMKTDI